jgi:threonine/homoserine/homoserine lactone efflux protein
MVLGVFLGSASWWFLLSSVVGQVRRQVAPGLLRWVNRGSGIIITGFGLAAIATALAG